MTTLVFCLEEPSAKTMLEGVLPRLLPEHITTRYMVFEGKQDLHKQLSRKLRLWQGDDALFVVMRDQDAGDCHLIKQQLLALCQEAGKSALVRIACRELESFYLGDLAAVEQGLGLKGLAKQQNSRKFRDPDQLVNAAEELFKVTGRQYQKVSGSRAIAPHLALDDSNRSSSFRALITGIQRICAYS